MLNIFSPPKLARWSARHPWIVIAAWVVLLAGAAFATTRLTFDEQQVILGSESYRADERLEDLRGEKRPHETIIVSAGDGGSIDDVRYREYVQSFAGLIRQTEGVAEVFTFFDTGEESLVSQDRSKTLIAVTLEGDTVDAAKTVEPLVSLIDEQDSGDFRVLIVGDGSINKEIQEAFEKDLQMAEYIGIPAAMVVLLVVFGAAVAAGVPIVLGLAGIFLSVGLTAALSRILGINSMVINMITMIGLAVGIDYTLFIVERFREERAKGVEKIDAIVNSGNTASRAVLFSGLTVIIAMAGMFIVPATTFHGLGIGAITVVFAAVAVALTLLPAVLSLLGDKINWLHLPGRKERADHESEEGFWGRSTATVMRHPVVAIVASVAILLAAAAPFLTIQLGSMGLRDFPRDLETVQAFLVLDDDFSAGRISPAEITFDGDVDSPAMQDGIRQLEALLAEDERFSNLTALEMNADGTLGALSVQVDGDSLGPDARAAVEDLRNDYLPAAFSGAEVDIAVTGGAASTTDYVDAMNKYLPLVVAFVLALSFVLLMMVFRSIVIPVKAILMNLLSVGAAYGLIVLVFQHGVGADLFGFNQSDSIEAFLPIFMFAVLFGLSMDYHVFLLSRIQERYLQTGDNAGSVAYGLRSTAHIITGAALIMIVVFGGFALGDMTSLQQTGFGLAVAVLIDATLVRTVLVPASMQMLGDWNWYLPSWLQWLPRISVEGGHEHEPAAPKLVPALGGGSD